MRTEVGHFFTNQFLRGKMILKPALTITEQIDLLKARGMLIENNEKATEFLQGIHYYRLNVYFHRLMDLPDHFRPGTTFGEVMAIYANDSWMRNQIFSILEPIEIKMRAHISHYLGIVYGSDAFYQPGIYKNFAFCFDVRNRCLGEVLRNNQDPVVRHHLEKYAGKFPIWVIVEYLSFNLLSKYFSSLTEEDKKRIAIISYSINESLLGRWMHSLSVLRNICAHYGYLYRRVFDVRPMMAKSFDWPAKKNGLLFAQFLVMRRLSDPLVWDRHINLLIERTQTDCYFSLRDYGFPDDWQGYLK